MPCDDNAPPPEWRQRASSEARAAGEAERLQLILADAEVRAGDAHAFILREGVGVVEADAGGLEFAASLARLSSGYVSSSEAGSDSSRGDKREHGTNRNNGRDGSRSN